MRNVPTKFRKPQARLIFNSKKDVKFLDGRIFNESGYFDSTYLFPLPLLAGLADPTCASSSDFVDFLDFLMFEVVF